MTKHQLQNFKDITTWSGVLITVCGIALNLSNGGSIIGGSISLFGVFVTCCGNWINSALSRHQAAEKAAAEKEILELTERIESAEDYFGDADLKRLVEREASRYAEENYDAWRGK